MSYSQSKFFNNLHVGELDSLEPFRTRVDELDCHTWVSTFETRLGDTEDVES